MPFDISVPKLQGVIIQSWSKFSQVQLKSTSQSQKNSFTLVYLKSLFRIGIGHSNVKEFCPVFYVELPNESDVADISVQKIASFERKLWENTSVFEKSFG